LIVNDERLIGTILVQQYKRLKLKQLMAQFGLERHGVAALQIDASIPSFLP